MKAQTVKPGIYSVDLIHLEKLGWNIDNDDVANALSLNPGEADEYVRQTYHAEITLKEDGKTVWRLVNTQKKLNGIDEGGDDEPTGDDQQTLKDLAKLIEQDNVWNIRHF